MPKFDYIIQNPPYSGSLHLEFFKRGLKLLSTNGQMIIIEPASWLINIHDNSKTSSYKEMKSLVTSHVKSVVIENFNDEFSINMQVPLSITHVDLSAQYSQISLSSMGDSRTVSSLDACNLICSDKILRSILDKCLSYKDMMRDHFLTKHSKITDPDICYAPVSDTMRGGIGDPRFTDGWYINNYYRCYYYHCFIDKGGISKTVPKRLATGYTYKNPKYSDEDSKMCIRH